MYETFFGLRERPFDLSPSPRFLVLTDSHREALRNLEYAIASRKGVTLLVGEAGSGKTTVIRAAIEKQPQRVHCVHLNNPTLSRAEFVEMLALKFGLSERASLSKATLLAELERLLQERRDAGETNVLIIDEAQSLPLDILEEIRLLANIERDDEKLLTVILAGQPEIAGRLNSRELRQLKQRVALRCEIVPLTPQETATYLAGRLKAAGGSGSLVFTREAIDVIHRASRGLPRMINVIADNALLGAFAADERTVTAAIVREVCSDFDYPRSAANTAPTGLIGEAGSSEPVLSAESPARANLATDDDDRPDASGQGSSLFSAFGTKRSRFSFFRG